MEEPSNTRPKRLLEYLPAIYQERTSPDRRKPDAPDRPNYLLALLEPFESILLGSEQGTGARGQTDAEQDKQPAHSVSALREKIARLHELFDARQAPEEFLPWLASWAALSLRATMKPKKKRDLIANIIPLYRIRGTKAYVERLLELCVDAPASVSEDEIPPLQLGIHCTVGEDMYLGGGAPHYFRVTLVASDLNALEVQAQRQLAYEVVELAKPAHTAYEFQVISAELQVAVHSTVGLDTVLGAAPAQSV
jgi:phage tail-like protein